MKKALLIVVVAALALTLVPLAIAGGHGGGGWKHGKAKFNFVGQVVEPDADAPPGTLTIKVKAGTKTVRKLVRAETPTAIAVDPLAKIRMLTEDGAVDMGLADIEPGDWVKARGKITSAGSVVITSLKYRDLTPDIAPPADEITPPADDTPPVVE